VSQRGLVFFLSLVVVGQVAAVILPTAKV